MGTNYHWMKAEECDPADPIVHIGKRISLGAGNGSAFIWAQPKREVIELCNQHLDEPVIEGDDCYTGRQFLLLLDEIVEHRHDQVGEWFC